MHKDDSRQERSDQSTEQQETESKACARMEVAAACRAMSQAHMAAPAHLGHFRTMRWHHLLASPDSTSLSFGNMPINLPAHILAADPVTCHNLHTLAHFVC